MTGVRAERRARGLGLLALALALVLAWFGSSLGATPLSNLSGEEAATALQSELPRDLTREEVRDLLSRLSDDQVRAVLLAQLDKAATAAGTEADFDARKNLFERAHERFALISDRLGATLTAGDELRGAPARFWSQITVGGTESGLLVLLEYALFFVVAWLAEHLYTRATRSIGRQSPAPGEDSIGARVGILVIRAAVEVTGILVFALVAIAAMCLVMLDNEWATLVFMNLLGPVVIVRLAAVASRAVFAPAAAAVRVLPLSNQAARTVHVRVIAFAGVWFLTWVPVQLLENLGFGPDEVSLMATIMGAAVVAFVLYLIWESREPVARLIRGDQWQGQSTGGFLESLAGNWHWLAMAYVVLVWLMAMAHRLETGQDPGAAGFLSLMLVAAVPLADAGLRRLVARFFSPEDEEREAFEEAPPPRPVGADVAHVDDDEFERPPSLKPVERSHERAAKYQAAVLRNLRILLGIVVVFLFAEIWHIDLGALAKERVGARITQALFDVGLTVLLAYAVWSVVKVAVERHAGEAEEVAPGEGDMGGTGRSRIETLLPLFRKFIAITLVVMVVMISLSALGVNIGPLLAGAGMLGIAVGFGAQTLVKDVISGMFFLLDDAFRMGEYVEIDQIRGTVEKISVRSLQLRHHNGPVHTLPFGEIRHLTNYSRDYAIMKFEIRLPFETDIDKVRKIIKKTGLAMMEDEELGPMMLAPMKSQGVNRMDDSALIVRCKFTAKPGEQFVLRREAYMRIQQALAEAGIHFAPRRVIVESASPNLSREALEAAAGSIDSPVPGGTKPDDRG